MEKFNRVLRGYNPDEVNSFIDRIIDRVESMVEEIKDKDEEILLLKQNLNDYESKINQYSQMEETLQRAIFMAEKTSQDIKLAAHNEREVVIEDAKKTASRIVNEALMRADKIEQEVNLLRRNSNMFKRRLKSVIEEQLEMVDDIEKIEF